MSYQRSVVVGILSIVLALVMMGSAWAQVVTPGNYPDWKFDTSDYPFWVTLDNNYIACLVGVQGNIKAKAAFSDGTDGRGDKVPTTDEHDWRVSGRYGVVALAGDPDEPRDDYKPITFMGMAPCHYFGYWKLRVGNQIRMIGDDTGRWYTTGVGQPIYSPTVYAEPPADLKAKEPRLGVAGPFIRSIWATDSSTPNRPILTEIRIHLVRDMVRFEYRITNTGSVTENVGFSQNGDVECGDPVPTSEQGGYYGPYSNQNFAFLSSVGAAQPITRQRAMIFGGYDPADLSHKTLNPPVPDSFEVYDDVQNPINGTRNILGLEDATKPDVLAIGEYNDLFHRDMWVPIDYKPDTYHGILDMCWVLCWEQKPLAPGATRTIVTYYGMASATSRWTYRVGRTSVRDSSMLAVQAPKSLKYDSTSMQPNAPEIMPDKFEVKAYVYNLATDPGPYDLRDAIASIWLPPGLQLVEGILDNEPRKEIGIVAVNSESAPVKWTVMATGDYVGELPIYVSVVDNDPSGKHWQQTVVRKIFVPATKRGQFTFGWQLMHVPFVFNNASTDYVFRRALGTFSAKYWDAATGVYKPVLQLKPGQAFWMYLLDGPTWKVPEPFFLVPDAAIVGEASGSGKQTSEQRIQLYKGWNMIGNPFVYPICWGQVLVYSGDETRTLDDAYRNGWLNKTLFSWNTDKWDYDITSDAAALLNPWKGYWVMANRPVILIFRPPVLPGGDVTANPGGI